MGKTNINEINYTQTLIIKNYKNQIDLIKTAFSYESRFLLGDDKQWVWRIHTAMRKTDQFPTYLMIYGAVNLKYK